MVGLNKFQCIIYVCVHMCVCVYVYAYFMCACPYSCMLVFVLASGAHARLCTRMYFIFIMLAVMFTVIVDYCYKYNKGHFEFGI